MTNSQILIKISNKLSTLINNLYDLSSEEIGYKIQNIYWHLKQLKRDDYLIRVIKNQFELASTSIVGSLSSHSKSNLKKLLSEIHGFIKAYELVITVEEHGYIDDSFLESYEPYIDIESGCSIDELNTHVKDEIYSILRSKSSDDDPKLDYLLLESSAVFDDSVSVVKKYSERYYMDMRQKLSEDIEGYGIKEKADSKEMYRQYQSSQLFFSPSENMHPDVLTVSNKMFGNRTGVRKHEDPIELTGILPRNVITAAFSAVRNVTGHFQPNVPPMCRERVEIVPTVLNWQNKPYKHNQGNLHIDGLGRYGYYNSKNKYDACAVLSSIDEITTEWISEEELAKYMIRYSKTGKPLSSNDLGISPTKKNNTLINRVNRILFLTSCAEIWRYMYTSADEQNLEKNEMHVSRIAFANAHARALTLIKEGKLTMSEVFDEDADFGLPSGTKIASKITLPKIIRKFILLNELFTKEEVIYYDPNAINFMKRFPEGGVSNFRRSHVYELYDTYDKDGKYEEDDSSDDESSYTI